QTYLRISGIGLFPALWVMVLRSYLSALEHLRVVLVVSVLVLIINAIVSYGLIFGRLGLPEWGLVGAAVAAVIVQGLSLIGFVAYIQMRLADQNMFVRFWRADPDAMWSVARLAVPISVTALAESGLFAASAFMMGALGKIELGSHALVLQFAALTFMIHLGLSQAATVLAGREFARRDRSALALTGATSMAVSAMISMVVIGVFLTLPDLLIGSVVDKADPDAAAIVTLGVWLMVMAAAFQFVDGAQVMALGILRGMQDTKGPMWIASIAYWVIGMPVGYYLAFETPLRETGVWLGLVVGLALTAVLLWWRFIDAIRKMPS
ncbi:MAG: MATE family efflux transporter, partial [Planktomarina sp.]